MATSTRLSMPSVISGFSDRWFMATQWTARFMGSLLLVVETMRLAMVIWSPGLTR